MIDRIRQWVWAALGPPPQPQAPAQPVGISADGLPLHLMPPECPVCTELEQTLRLRQAEFLSHISEDLKPFAVPPRFCDDCGSIIAWTHDKAGNGFRSQSASHGHLHQSDFGAWMKSKVYRELCPECYRKDWIRVYPEETCPV